MKAIILTLRSIDGDKWVEVLPTNQVVAVEVQYDPKTGLQT
jgi:hypothetical protein